MSLIAIDCLEIVLGRSFQGISLNAYIFRSSFEKNMIILLPSESRDSVNETTALPNAVQAGGSSVFIVVPTTFDPVASVEVISSNFTDGIVNDVVLSDSKFHSNLAVAVLCPNFFSMQTDIEEWGKIF